jgi:sugar O-acyltransferase (sialic acid O-acetyltransferase NeuD family)
MKKAIIGYGGHAREVEKQIGKSLPFFVDDLYLTSDSLPLSEFDPNEYEVIIAISNPKIREEISFRLPKETKYFTFIHPTSILLDSNIEIGYGSFIGAYSILTTDIKLGNHSILNRSCQIGHDTIVGDFLSMMPGSIISGNVTVGDNLYMGTNSSIREKINICSDVTIGMNSAVVKDITKKGIYVGLPAKKIK